MPAELPRGAVRDHAGVLAQGPTQATHLRDPAVEAGGLLHHGQLRVQGGVRLLSPAIPAAPPTRTLASCKFTTLFAPAMLSLQHPKIDLIDLI